MFALSKYNSLFRIGLIAILFFGALSGCDFISCGGDLSIHEACAKGCYKMVERMIAEDPSVVNAEHDRMQELPLHFAGSAKVAQLLIDNGADVNAVDGFGDTPLHDAVKAEVAELLIGEGADVNAFNEVRETPLHRVKNAEVARVLIENGADVNGVYGERVSPLYSAVLFSRADVVEVLIEEGADVNERVKQGWTLLHAAAVAKGPEVIQVLCDNGLDVNERDHYGATPLHVAAMNDHLKGAEKLLELGADLSAMLDDGVVSYQKSILTGRESHIRDVSGKTPLELAKSKKMRALLKKTKSS